MRLHSANLAASQTKSLKRHIRPEHAASIAHARYSRKRQIKESAGLRATGALCGGRGQKTPRTGPAEKHHGL